MGGDLKDLWTGSARAVALATWALATPAAAQDSPVHLDDALRAAARQTGREIIYPADAVKGRPAPPVNANARADDLVRLLLKGTDLEAEFRPDVIVVRQIRHAGTESSRDPTDEETVVVTATRIRGEPASTRVTTTDREAIELAGQPDLGEFARSLPQNFAGGQNPGVTGGGNQGGNNNVTGSSNINLRGIGEDATLTLINGHRVAYDGLTQGIDISAVPLVAVSRVEVVADTASALHGSDAVGGVVNVILRPDHHGLNALTRMGIADDGSFEQEQYSAIAGQTWADGGLMVAGDYSRNSRIVGRERPYNGARQGSTTLFPWRRGESAVAAAHQRLGAVTLAFDAQFSHRVSETVTPFTTAAVARVNGLIARPTVSFHAASPSARLTLPGSWTATLQGTISQSLSDLTSRRFALSAETTLRLRYRNRLRTAELGAEGPLVQLPGGTARLATGAGVRALDLSVRNTSTAAGVTRTTADYGGERDVLFAYGELAVPIFGTANAAPLARRLRVDVAARYENYKGLAEIVTPKLGAVYEPFAGITVKANWARAFKAPTLQQEKQIRQNALAPSSTFAGAPANRTILLLAGGGTPLKPERAESWSGSLEFRPSARFSIATSYFDVNYKDRVTTPISNVVNALVDPRYAGLITRNPTVAELNAVVATLPTGIANQTGQPYNPASVAAIIDNTLQNLARQHVRGVDLSIDYSTTMVAGARAGVTGSLSYLESDQQLGPGQATIQRAGTIFDPPHWRGRLGATWERRGVTLAGFATYSGENLDDRFTTAGTVGSFVTFDATLRAKSPATRGAFAGIKSGITVSNLFGEQPRRIPNLSATDPPYDSSNSSVLGRVISVTLSKAW